MYQKHLHKQKHNYALDFDDLIHFTAFMLDSNPDVLPKWQEMLHYIQVDEAQDSSDSQFHLGGDALRCAS